MENLIIAIDQSTSATKAMLFNERCEMLRRVNVTHEQYYPKSGWVEHDAEEIYRNVQKSIAELIKEEVADNMYSLAITNQRETVVVWNKHTGKPICNAVVWQCMRGADICNELKASGYSEIVQGISAGLAHSGKKVFVCGPACFYVARSLEQVKVDLAYSQNNVKILGVSGGVAYGALGATHHSLHDIAVLRTFPGMNIVLPCDARQTKKLVELLVDYPEPVYVRVGRAAVPDVYENDDFDFAIGKANMLLDGTDLTIIGTGETVYHTRQAALKLREYGISARVLDMSSIKPCDEEAVLKAASETGRIITVEEHSQYGGLGAMVTEIISEHPVPVKILGIPDENVVHGNSLEIFAHYGLDSSGIVKTALDFLK